MGLATDSALDAGVSGSAVWSRGLAPSPGAAGESRGLTDHAVGVRTGRRDEVRRLVVFMHTSLDGFVAGPNGEMDWIDVIDDYKDITARAALRLMASNVFSSGAVCLHYEGAPT